MSAGCRALGLFVVAAACLSGCGAAATSPDPADGQARMLAELEQVRVRSLVDNPFFQTKTVADAEAALAQFPANASALDRFALHVQLCDDYRRLGKIEKAIEHVEAAEALRASGRLGMTEAQSIGFIYERGVTYLRLGETENCIYCQSGESCILPIRGDGLHQHREGSRKAIECFLKVLQIKPDFAQAQWLLNIAAMTLGEYPDTVPPQFRIPPAAFESAVEFPRFAEIGKAAGLNTFNCGGGAVIDDLDGDSLFDVLISTWAPDGELQYFHHQPDGTFVDRTQEAGLTGLYGGINLVPADYDNDGRLDVLVTRGAWLAEAGRQPNSLLRNLGGGRFRDVTFDVGLAQVQWPTPGAGWADYDNDGDLDLYLPHEVGSSELYRNDGDGFTDVTLDAGVANQRFAKAVTWGDYDQDRRPDLYVANLAGGNRLYHNNGDGTFTDVAESLQVARPMISFPTWFWDVNNDGALDLFAASYDRGVQHVARDFLGLPHLDEPDRLYLGDGRGGFQDVAEAWGLTRSTQPMGANFGDLDNDGFPDFYLGTGYPEYDALMPNLMFRNRGGGGFDDVTFAGGFGHIQKGHGTVFADLDNDGDQDVFIQLGGAFPGDAFGDALFENPGFGRHWLRVRLIGRRSNRSAIGARIRADIIDDSTRRSVYKWVNSGGHFGGNPLEQHLGLGQAERVESLEVHWPTTDQTQRFTNVAVNQRIEIEEGAADYRNVELKSAPFRRAKPAAASP